MIVHRRDSHHFRDLLVSVLSDTPLSNSLVILIQCMFSVCYYDIENLKNKNVNLYKPIGFLCQLSQYAFITREAVLCRGAHIFKIVHKERQK